MGTMREVLEAVELLPSINFFQKKKVIKACSQSRVREARELAQALTDGTATVAHVRAARSALEAEHQKLYGIQFDAGMDGDEKKRDKYVRAALDTWAVVEAIDLLGVPAR